METIILSTGIYKDYIGIIQKENGNYSSGK